MHHHDLYANFTERRTTHLHYYCKECQTGKVLRCHADGRANLDDNGSEAIVYKVYDRCESCGDLSRDSGVIRFALTNIETLFLDFEFGHLTRHEFNNAIAALLHQPAAKWA